MKKIFAILLALYSLLHPTQALAQSSGLAISPATIELLVKPNTRLIQNIELHNNSSSTLFKVELNRLIPQGKNGGSTIDLSPLNYDQIPLILKLNNIPLQDNQTLTLPTKIKTTITLAIETAKTDISQAENLALTFTPINNQANITSQPIIGLPILITITKDGNLPLSLELEPLNLPTLVDSTQDLTFSPTLTNQTEFMLRPKGTLTLTNSKGEVTMTQSLIPALILGQTSRTLAFTQDQLGATIPRDISRLGPHTLKLTITTEGGTTILDSSHSIIFLPLKLIIIALAIVFVSIAFIWSQHKQK